jgi:hypothetical protein
MLEAIVMNRGRWTIGVLGLAFALGACPGDDDDDDASEEGSGSHDVDASVAGSGGSGRAGSDGDGGSAGRTGGSGGQGGSGAAGASTGSGELRWYQACGDPICTDDPESSDDPSIPNCTDDEEPGKTCNEKGARCDGIGSCGANWLCSDRDPISPGGCPISRARFKQDIDYVSEQERLAYHEQLVSLPLASWHYRTAPSDAPQLGFIIEDIEPSAAVSGDRVNMYGYLSMAVAAIQVQQDQIDALEHELRALRDRLAAQEGAPICAP